MESNKKLISKTITTMKQVQTTELIRTSKSWEGVELPDYLQGAS